VFVGSIGDLVFLKGDWVRGRREQGLETGVLEEHDSVRLGHERFELGLLTLQGGGGRVRPTERKFDDLVSIACVCCVRACA
jgi:hypothetical protein